MIPMEATNRTTATETTPAETTETVAEPSPTLVGAGRGATQLRLLSPAPWRLTDSTRQIGRQGIASARAALRAARRPASHDDVPTSAAA